MATDVTLTVNGSSLTINDPDCNTYEDVIRLFRDSLNIPESPTVLSNGEPVEDYSEEIPDGAEVALNKPAGAKG